MRLKTGKRYYDKIIKMCYRVENAEGYKYHVVWDDGDVEDYHPEGLEYDAVPASALFVKLMS